MDSVEEFRQSLNDLTMNSKPLISMLTMLAEENRQHAPLVVSAVEDYLRKAPSNAKLPAMYLIDSVMKNIPDSDYRELFEKNLVNQFCTIFDQVDEKTRMALYKLRQTWAELISPNQLYLLDVRVHSMDPAWPVTAIESDGITKAVTPSSRSEGHAHVHVNPKFLQYNSSQGAMVRPHQHIHVENTAHGSQTYRPPPQASEFSEQSNFGAEKSEENALNTPKVMANREEMLRVKEQQLKLAQYEQQLKEKELELKRKEQEIKLKQAAMLREKPVDEAVDEAKGNISKKGAFRDPRLLRDPRLRDRDAPPAMRNKSGYANSAGVADPPDTRPNAAPSTSGNRSPAQSSLLNIRSGFDPRLDAVSPAEYKRGQQQHSPVKIRGISENRDSDYRPDVVGNIIQGSQQEPKVHVTDVIKREPRDSDRPTEQFRTEHDVSRTSTQPKRPPGAGNEESRPIRHRSPDRSRRDGFHRRDVSRRTAKSGQDSFQSAPRRFGSRSHEQSRPASSNNRFGGTDRSRQDRPDDRRRRLSRDRARSPLRSGRDRDRVERERDRWPARPSSRESQSSDRSSTETRRKQSEQPLKKVSGKTGLLGDMPVDIKPDKPKFGESHKPSSRHRERSYRNQSLEQRESVEIQDDEDDQDFLDIVPAQHATTKSWPLRNRQKQGPADKPTADSFNPDLYTDEKSNSGHSKPGHQRPARQARNLEGPSVTIRKRPPPLLDELPSEPPAHFPRLSRSPPPPAAEEMISSSKDVDLRPSYQPLLPDPPKPPGPSAEEFNAPEELLLEQQQFIIEALQRKLESGQIPDEKKEELLGNLAQLYQLQNLRQEYEKLSGQLRRGGRKEPEFTDDRSLPSSDPSLPPHPVERIHRPQLLVEPLTADGDEPPILPPSRSIDRPPLSPRHFGRPPVEPFPQGPLLEPPIRPFSQRPLRPGVRPGLNQGGQPPSPPGDFRGGPEPIRQFRPPLPLPPPPTQRFDSRAPPPFHPERGPRPPPLPRHFGPRPPGPFSAEWRYPHPPPHHMRMGFDQSPRIHHGRFEMPENTYGSSFYNRFYEVRGPSMPRPMYPMRFGGPNIYESVDSHNHPPNRQRMLGPQAFEHRHLQPFPRPPALPPSYSVSKLPELEPVGRTIETLIKAEKPNVSPRRDNRMMEKPSPRSRSPPLPLETPISVSDDKLLESAAVKQEPVEKVVQLDKDMDADKKKDTSNTSKPEVDSEVDTQKDRAEEPQVEEAPIELPEPSKLVIYPGPQLIVDDRIFNVNFSKMPLEIDIDDVTYKVNVDLKNRTVTLNGEVNYRLGDPVSEIRLNGKRHIVFFHGPQRTIWLDEQPFQLRIDSPPQKIELSDKIRAIKISGATGEIAIDGEVLIKYNDPAQIIKIGDEEHSISFTAPLRPIIIDNKNCGIPPDCPRPAVLIDDVLHGICFDGPPCELVLGGRAYKLPTNEYTTINLDGVDHKFALGGPGKELIIDGCAFEIIFGGECAHIELDGKLYDLKLSGAAPPVRVLAAFPEGVPLPPLADVLIWPVPVEPSPLKSADTETPVAESAMEADSEPPNKIVKTEPEEEQLEKTESDDEADEDDSEQSPEYDPPMAIGGFLNSLLATHPGAAESIAEEEDEAEKERIKKIRAEQRQRDWEQAEAKRLNRLREEQARQQMRINARVAEEEKRRATLVQMRAAKERAEREASMYAARMQHQADYLAKKHEADRHSKELEDRQKEVDRAQREIDELMQNLEQQRADLVKREEEFAQYQQKESNENSPVIPPPPFSASQPVTATGGSDLDLQAEASESGRPSSPGTPTRDERIDEGVEDPGTPTRDETATPTKDEPLISERPSEPLLMTPPPQLAFAIPGPGQPWREPFSRFGAPRLVSHPPWAQPGFPPQPVPTFFPTPVFGHAPQPIPGAPPHLLPTPVFPPAQQPTVTVATQPQPMPSIIPSTIASATAQNPVDVKNLFNKLVEFGIIQKKDQIPGLSASSSSSAHKRTDSPSLDLKSSTQNAPDHSDWSLDSLKIFDPKFQTIQYSGMQCSTCGVRFRDNMALYKAHLDNHLREERMPAARTETYKDQIMPVFRHWYLKADDWVKHDFKAVKKGVKQTIVDVTPSLNRSVSKSEHVPAMPEYQRCTLCNETFEQYFSEEVEGWCLSDAVIFDGKVYHPTCRDDMLLAKESGGSGQTSPVRKNAKLEQSQPESSLACETTQPDVKEEAASNEASIETEPESCEVPAVKPELGAEITDSDSSYSRIKTESMKKESATTSAESDSKSTEGASTSKVDSSDPGAEMLKTETATPQIETNTSQDVANNESSETEPVVKSAVEVLKIDAEISPVIKIIDAGEEVPGLECKEETKTPGADFENISDDDGEEDSDEEDDGVVVKLSNIDTAKIKSFAATNPRGRGGFRGGFRGRGTSTWRKTVPVIESEPAAVCRESETHTVEAAQSAKSAERPASESVIVMGSDGQSTVQALQPAASTTVAVSESVSTQQNETS